MNGEHLDATNVSYSNIPVAAIQFPDTLRNKLRKRLWRLYTPHHPKVRDALLAARILRHEGRQDFLIGIIAPHSNIEKVISHLVSRGYGNHFVAWEEDGQVASLRLPNGHTHQYHIRIFADGEIRAHYERTPEVFPFSHWKMIGLEEKREYFIDLLCGHLAQDD